MEATRLAVQRAQAGAAIGRNPRNGMRYIDLTFGHDRSWRLSIADAQDFAALIATLAEQAIEEGAAESEARLAQ